MVDRRGPGKRKRRRTKTEGEELLLAHALVRALDQSCQTAMAAARLAEVSGEGLGSGIAREAVADSAMHPANDIYRCRPQGLALLVRQAAVVLSHARLEFIGDIQAQSGAT